LSLKRKDISVLEGSVWKKLIAFALPLMLTNWLHMLFNSADSLVVGQFAGSAALAAVGAAFPITMTTISLLGGLAIGITVCASNDFGAHDEEGYSQTVHTAIPIALIVGVVVMVLGFFFARAPLRFLSTPADIIDDSELYLRIYFLCIPGHMLYDAGASALRSRGDSQNPLKFLLISGFVNVILNVFFIVVFKMTVAGVAWATVISKYLSTVLVYVYLLRPGSPVKLELKKLVFDRKKLGKIIRVGLPAGIQSALIAASDMPLQSAVNSLGSMAVSGNAAALNVDGFNFTSMDALGQACTVFTGQCVGAKNHERGRQVFKKSLILTVIVGFVIGWTGFLLRRQIISLFVPGAAQAIEYGASRCTIVSTTSFIFAFLTIMNATLRAYGSSTVPAIISIIGLCGFRFVWAKTFFLTHSTMFWLYFSYPAAWVLCIIVTSLLFKTLIRKAQEKKN